MAAARVQFFVPERAVAHGAVRDGVRPLQHEIHALRSQVHRRTGLRVEDWNSADELARMLQMLINEHAATKEPPILK